MSGVYQIRNIQSGKLYIGGTTQDFSERWDQHKSKLSRGTHPNDGLQTDWNKYGEDRFVFEIIEDITETEKISAVEQKWLDRLFRSQKPTYNILRKTGFPKDEKRYAGKGSMARRDSFFRGFGMRPGRYERKESNIRTDWLMPILQGLACVTILFLDFIFLGSWFFILPADVDWWIGIIAYFLIFNTALSGDWLFIRLWPFSWPGKWQNMPEGYVWRRIKEWKTWIGFLIVLAGSLVSIWLKIWDWWWLWCLRLPDAAIPVPSVSGSSPAFWLGVFVVFVGIIGLIFKPSKYALSLFPFGAIISTVSHYFSPVAVMWTQRRPLLIYCIWAAWCVAWVLGTATLYIRLFFLEVLDPYTPHENNRRIPETNFPVVNGPGSGEGQTSGM